MEAIPDPNFISIRNARQNNLAGINVDIPKNKFVVITGVSGSGKSSLAFDTIYAEGQRRYVESLSPYARQFLQIGNKPDVDSITGLSPSISINQKTTSKNPRSTVGTATEIYDYLRLLFARVGIAYSPATGLPIKAQSVSQIVDSILQLPPDRKAFILAPIVRGRKGQHTKEIEELRKRGLTRVLINEEAYEIDDLPKIDKNKHHNISALVDRIITGEQLTVERLAGSVETALKLGEGIVELKFVDHTLEEQKKIIFSEKFACPVSGFSLEEIEPRLFSFNSPYGACPACDGLGKEKKIDPNSLIENPKLSLLEGAIALIGEVSYLDYSSFQRLWHNYFTELSKTYHFPIDSPWEALSKEAKNVVLFGDPESKSKLVAKGVVKILEENPRLSEIIDDVSGYFVESNCRACNGSRLKTEALHVKINDKNIAEVAGLNIEEGISWFGGLAKALSEQENKIAAKIISEIIRRLTFLREVGVEYLTLSREAGTLSGGESQRIRLASQIGSGLTGVIYVLDEPSIGLHQCDNQLLINTLKRLRDQGNSVIVVEHDEETMLQADYILDIGPGAGINGGKLIGFGTPEELMQNEESITGQYLSGKQNIPLPSMRRSGHLNQYITIAGANSHNLQEVTVNLPLGKFICVTGASGGGKSSLIIETLYKVIYNKLNHTHHPTGSYQEIRGLEFIDKVIEIDQSPIGRTPLSNPATYTGAFTPIRQWYANLPESKALGYSIGRFSFNVKGGRCEACRGEGLLKIEMHFLPDVYIECDQCKGKRYNRETLEVKYKGKNIADILNLTVDEAVGFFQATPPIHDKLAALKQVGLGYMRLGQSSLALSGGEAQRVKLSKELSKRATGKTLYILDEPTTGLHIQDIKNLLGVLSRLVDRGNTVVVIEHNMHVIKTADYIIDIGPKGGNRGGRVVAEGTPEEIVAQKDHSITGQFLQGYLQELL